MSQRFLHVTLTGDELPEDAKLEKLFDKAAGWRRTTPRTWVLLTGVDNEKWVKRIRGVVGADETFYIHELAEDEIDGWMDDDFWEFLGFEPDEIDHE